MLSFKSFLEESDQSDAWSHLDYILENYDEYDTFDEMPSLDEDYAPSQSEGIKSAREAIDKHMGEFKNGYGAGDSETDDVKKQKAISSAKRDAVSQAKEFFKNKDFRTIKEKAAGQLAKKARMANNAGLKPSHKNWQNQSNFEAPIKVTGKITTATDKHLSSGSGFKIPEGFPNAGKGATVSALRLTPGTANLGDGKMLKSCPKASKGCEGEGDVCETGVKKGALCLTARGTDAFVGSRRAKLARTRAFFDPEARKHATVLLSHELESAHAKTFDKNPTTGEKEQNRVHHFRPNDSSDIDLVTSAVNKHYPHIVTYGYSKHLKHDSENTGEGNKAFNHVTRSDIGPEYNAQNLRNDENRTHKMKTIEHLMGGKSSRAYMVFGQTRKRKAIGTPADATSTIHTVRIHKYDENGKHIGYEDFDADRNSANGDLRMYDKPAVRNTTAADGRKKGAITVTDISSGNSTDISSNPMVHHLDDNHMQPDPNHPGKHIYHVDPPNGDWRNPTGKLQKIVK